MSPVRGHLYVAILLYICAQILILSEIDFDDPRRVTEVKKSFSTADPNRMRVEQRGIGVVNNIAARLRVDMENTTVPYTAGAFIHVSKTGGSTISKLLKNGCHSFVPKPCHEVSDEAPLSKLTTYFHVPDFPRLTFKHKKMYRNYDFYVFTVRDPFDRAQSAFLYSAPENQIFIRFDWGKYNDTLINNPTLDSKRLMDNMRSDIYRTIHKESKSILAYRCFPTLQRFVDYIGDEPNNYKDASWEQDLDHCGQIARLAIRHKVDGMPHLFWSLGRLIDTLHDLNEKKAIFVIRKEFMWPDWVAANRYFGYHDGGIFDQPLQNLRDSSTFPVKRNLTEDGRRTLCRAIVPDYEVYFNILKRAINLKTADLEKSLEIARRNCPMLNLNLTLNFAK